MGPYQLPANVGDVVAAVGKKEAQRVEKLAVAAGDRYPLGDVMVVVEGKGHLELAVVWEQVGLD